MGKEGKEGEGGEEAEGGGRSRKGNKRRGGGGGRRNEGGHRESRVSLNIRSSLLHDVRRTVVLIIALLFNS